MTQSKSTSPQIQSYQSMLEQITDNYLPKIYLIFKKSEPWEHKKSGNTQINLLYARFHKFIDDAREILCDIRQFNILGDINQSKIKLLFPSQQLNHTKLQNIITNTIFETYKNDLLYQFESFHIVLHDIFLLCKQFDTMYKNLKLNSFKYQHHTRIQQIYRQIIKQIKVKVYKRMIDFQLVDGRFLINYLLKYEKSIPQFLSGSLREFQELWMNFISGMLEQIKLLHHQGLQYEFEKLTKT